MHTTYTFTAAQVIAILAMLAALLCLIAVLYFMVKAIPLTAQENSNKRAQSMYEHSLTKMNRNKALYIHYLHGRLSAHGIPFKPEAKFYGMYERLGYDVEKIEAESNEEGRV